ncbi:MULTISPECIES: low molecular weight protein-tyrosine-phosphatase [unclassified Helicobacter]|uniref:low molecular weight protein-tyrosine-phosphatase n=1 Tax=unclassified Helicobacter TaxID=2593540 RepID=UPI000AB6CFCF|nr:MULTISPECIES: low molecular weight protein-tyrosine-phosphatase [unclassified Helicobacter]
MEKLESNNKKPAIDSAKIAESSNIAKSANITASAKISESTRARLTPLCRKIAESSGADSGVLDSRILDSRADLKTLDSHNADSGAFISFVCLGNICRSPLAEGIAKHLCQSKLESIVQNVIQNSAQNMQATTQATTQTAAQITKQLANFMRANLHFSSAGTSGFHNGDIIDARSIATAKKHGIDISRYTSKQVSVYAHADIDLFVAMDMQNLAALRQLGFGERAVLLGDFGLGGAVVPDPYYGGASGFDKVYNMLENGITIMLESIAQGIITQSTISQGAQNPR